MDKNELLKYLEDKNKDRKSYEKLTVQNLIDELKKELESKTKADEELEKFNYVREFADNEIIFSYNYEENATQKVIYELDDEWITFENIIDGKTHRNSFSYKELKAITNKADELYNKKTNILKMSNEEIQEFVDKIFKTHTKEELIQCFVKCGFINE